MRVHRFIFPGFLALALGVAFATSLTALLLLRPAPTGAQGTSTVRYVAITGTDFGNTCTNPADPCGTIQHAVDMANPGDEIRIATGVYTHTLQRNGITQSVYISKSLILRGGYTTTTWAMAPKPNPDMYPVLITPQGLGRGIVITPAVNATPGTVPNVGLEALDVFDGNAMGLGGGAQAEDAGGGIYAVTATLAMTDVSVISNTAEIGGGLYARNTVLNVGYSSFLSNTATAGNGGGLHLADASGASFLYTIISSNKTWQSDGGGVYMKNVSEVMWDLVKIFGNRPIPMGAA
ncbi:MAG: hypothetical protein Q9O62_15450 [Ardenticatenia bacterium]|nr:hypothetical protein [Ardenticatenia bacterium]